MSVYLALLHHPVKDREGEVITTAITNLDVHDIARSSRTYGLGAYFLVTPIEAQRTLVNRILGHWREGSGGRRIPERMEALSIARACPSLDDAIAEIEALEGTKPRLWATAARAPEGVSTLPHAEARAVIDDAPTLLVFGTGHGLAPAVLDRVDALLAPIEGRGYNHLSVRAAVAILLDRLLG